MKITCLSDSHGLHRQITIPECDLILHAGDLTNVGEYEQLEDFNNWIGELGIPTILTPGNHDKTIPTDPSKARSILSNCEVLIDSETYFRGLKIYGSPWTPWFGGHYWVYNRRRGPSINDAWVKIPKDTDILITHGPPLRILDDVERAGPQGCEDLLRRVKQIKPRLHVFGHLHLQGGQKKYMFGSDTYFVNAAICNESYQPINPIITIDL